MRQPPPLLASLLSLFWVFPALAGGIYGVVQEGTAGSRVRVLIARVDRPVPTERTAPIFMDFEEAIVLVEVLRGAEGVSELQVGFGAGESRLAVSARRVTRRSEEFAMYPEAEGRIFEAKVPVASVYQTPEATRNTTYSIFRTTDNDDTLTFKSEMTGGKLPSQQLLFVDNSDSVEMEYDAEGNAVCRDLRGAASCETFNAGGVARVPLSISAGGVSLATSELLVERVPDWIYFSGHYPRAGGGHLMDASIYPEEVAGTNWKGALEVLVFASCYAVEINTAAAPDFQPGYGIDGARWWKKFEGTLLGYRHLAPSRAASAVTRKFIKRVRESDVSATEDPDGWSRMVAEAWMRGNTMDGTLATNAAAVDSQGRYYAVKNSELVLEGLQYRTGIRWQTVEKDIWNSQYERTIGQYGRDRLLEEALVLVQPYGEAPPTLEALLASTEYRDLATRYGMPPEDPEVRKELAAAVTEARKEHFEGGDEWRWDAVVYQQIEALGGERPPTPAEVLQVFQTDDPNLVPKVLPPEQLEEILFKNFAYKVYDQAQEYDGETGTYRFLVPPAEIEAKLAKFFELTPARRAYLQETHVVGVTE